MATADSTRWDRLSQLADIDLIQFKAQLGQFESELDQARQQLDQLTDYRTQSESDLSKPADYNSITSLQRQMAFIDSLQVAMSQQQSVIEKKVQHLDQLREQVLVLYKKRESYALLAKQQKTKLIKARDKAESDFLDDLPRSDQD